MQLGAYPPATVHRLQNWQWALANPNIVCCSVDDSTPESLTEVCARAPYYKDLFADTDLSAVFDSVAAWWNSSGEPALHNAP